MSLRALAETEVLRLLRGWKSPVYMVISMALAVALAATVANANYHSYSPMDYHGLIWPFVCMLMIVCITIFASDAFSMDASRGTLQLYFLLPKKRSSILISKLFIPVLFFYIGLSMFTIALASVPQTAGFWKLWAVQVAADSLLFLALLFLTLSISITLKGGMASGLVSSLLMLFFILMLLQASLRVDIPNPFQNQELLLADLADGTLDTPLRAIWIGIALASFAALSHAVLSRKEVAE